MVSRFISLIIIRRIGLILFRYPLALFRSERCQKAAGPAPHYWLLLLECRRYQNDNANGLRQPIWFGKRATLQGWGSLEMGLSLLSVYSGSTIRATNKSIPFSQVLITEEWLSFAIRGERQPAAILLQFTKAFVFRGHIRSAAAMLEMEGATP